MTDEFKPLSYFEDLADLRHSSRVIRPKADLGTSAQLTVLPAALDFGSILVGEPSSIQFIVIQNTGYVDAIISSITSSSDLYTLTYNISDPIELGASLLVQVVFAPDAVTESPVDGLITITLSNGNEYTVSLSGSGI